MKLTPATPLLCLALILTSFIGHGQSTSQNKDQYQLSIRYTQEEIKIDGVLDEPIWQQTEAATDFWLQAPLTEKEPNKDRDPNDL